MIKIYTFSHKRPDFIEMQLKSFRKHIQDPFDFVIFNNAHFDLDRSQYDEIHKICKANNLTCLDIQKDPDLIKTIQSYNGENPFNSQGTYANPGIACGYPLTWAWKHYISKTDNMTVIIDSDMFFMQSENITQALTEHDIIYMPQSRGKIEYMWNGIVYLNLAKLPNKETLNWWCGFVEGEPVDVGGHTYYYLQKYKNQLKTASFVQHYVGEDPECDFSPANYEYFALKVDGRTIIHFRSGSFWDKKPPGYYEKKSRWLISKVNS